MDQRNPWQWDKPYAEPEAPAPAPEPKADTPVEPDGDPVWNTFTTHAQMDGWAAENDVTVPDNWGTMNLSMKREWLYLNVATTTE